MSAETADILTEAANVLRRNGWHQGYYYDQEQKTGGRESKDCAVCARGAINLAATGDNPWNDYFPAAVKASGAFETWLLDADRMGNCLGIADWNDEPNRTVKQVLAALEGAAAAERERAA